MSVSIRACVWPATASIRCISCAWNRFNPHPSVAATRGGARVIALQRASNPRPRAAGDDRPQVLAKPLGNVSIRVRAWRAISLEFDSLLNRLDFQSALARTTAGHPGAVGDRRVSIRVDVSQATGQQRAADHRSHVSIRTRVRRATSSPTSLAIRPTGFNSALRVAATRAKGRVFTSYEWFQSAPASGERPFHLALPATLGLVSIRARAWRATMSGPW